MGNVQNASDRVRGSIREFDGLRGIAILLVMTHHFWPRAGYWSEWAKLPHLGWVGVDLFFVLSGFLITGILLDSKNAPHFFRNFYMRRVIRIFPLYYLIVIACYIGIPFLQGGPWASSEFVTESGSPWWYLLYQGNLREAILGHEPAYVLAPLWSLSIEEQFYIVFPLLVLALDRAALKTLLLALLVLAPLFRLATALVWPDNERVQYLATPSRVDVLAMGGLLAIGFREPSAWLDARRLRRALAIALVIFVAAFALDGLDRTRFFGRVMGYSVVGFFFMIAVALALAQRESAGTAWLRWRPLMALGKICYGTYLLQRPTEVVLGKVSSALGHALSDASLGSVPLKMSAAIAAATLSWFCFERPILRLKQRFTIANHPQARENLNKAATIALAPASAN
jgi:peptidoglycan/LPS O-acetylase OafA/YrhL